jgi:pimeloyl-ACP methyl ester carboxylesterase
MSHSTALGQEHLAELTQGPICYRKRGEGAPIVFVHGVAVNGDIWRKVVPPLAEHFECITPDWPKGAHSLPMRANADLSPPGLADLVAEFLEELGLEDVTLVGNDTGGAICQLVVTRHPERIGRLVLTSCDAFERFPPPLFKFLRWAALVPGALFCASRLIRFDVVRGSPLAYGWALNRLPERPVLDSWTAPGRRGEIRRDAARVFRAISAEHTIWAADRLPYFHKPVLVAWGADDRLFPVSLGRRLAERFPEGRFELVENARTFVPEDNPQRLAGLIKEVLAEDR